MFNSTEMPPSGLYLPWKSFIVPCKSYKKSHGNHIWNGKFWFLKTSASFNKDIRTASDHLTDTWQLRLGFISPLFLVTALSSLFLSDCKWASPPLFSWPHNWPPIKFAVHRHIAFRNPFANPPKLCLWFYRAVISHYAFYFAYEGATFSLQWQICVSGW